MSDWFNRVSIHRNSRSVEFEMLTPWLGGYDTHGTHKKAQPKKRAKCHEIAGARTRSQKVRSKLGYAYCRLPNPFQSDSRTKSEHGTKSSNPSPHQYPTKKIPRPRKPRQPQRQSNPPSSTTRTKNPSSQISSPNPSYPTKQPPDLNPRRKTWSSRLIISPREYTEWRS